MPTFIDYHEKLPAIPPEVAKQMAAHVKAGKRDEFGSKPLNIFVGDAQGWCLTDAPDAATVIRTHKAQGFSLRKADVHEVRPLV